MGIASAEGALSRKQLENLLGQSLTRVEPSDRFIRKLRAHLVRISGERQPSFWVAIMAVGGASLLLMASMSVALRILLALLGLLGLMQRRRDSGSPKAASP